MSAKVPKYADGLPSSRELYPKTPASQWSNLMARDIETHGKVMVKMLKGKCRRTESNREEASSKERGQLHATEANERNARSETF
jgi:hypothetical protein